MCKWFFREMIALFIQCCQSCELKKNKVKKGIVTKPIISSNFNSRCQMDLIDLQSKPDEDYKFILNYQDHFTKYCLLRALKMKNAESVANQLKLIFSDFGPCKELQTDNGREFANSTIEKIVKDYGGELIHGKARHSQSQGSIERANRDVQNILTILMRRRNSTKWSDLLPEVQLMKNSRFHSGIKSSPYKALFGVESVYDDIELNRELQELKEKEKCELEVDSDDEMMPDSEKDNEETVQVVEEADEIQHRLENLEKTRTDASDAIKSQAAKMLERSENAFAPLEFGQSVLLPVPDVDRGKVDSRNIVGVIMKRVNDFYQIGTQSGMCF